MKTKLIVLFYLLLFILIIINNPIIGIFLSIINLFCLCHRINYLPKTFYNIIDYKMFYAKNLFDLLRDIKRNEVLNGVKLLLEEVDFIRDRSFSFSFFNNKIFIYDKPENYLHDIFVHLKCRKIDCKLYIENNESYIIIYKYENKKRIR